MAFRRPSWWLPGPRLTCRRGPRWFAGGARSLGRAGAATGAGATVAAAQLCWSPRPLLCEQAGTKGAAGGTYNGCAVVTTNSEYIDGIQIWGVGIKEDPVPGEKRGKGVQHLRSSQWAYDLACHIQEHYHQMCSMMKYAKDVSADPGCGGYDFRYFLNCSEGLFHKALDDGFHTEFSRDVLLMACWALMAAAEVEVGSHERAGLSFYDPQNQRHTAEWRQEMREKFYQRYLKPDVVFVRDQEDLHMERLMDAYGLRSCRFDLIPSLALERLDIHNELCAIKWKRDPGAWMRQGFLVSTRVDSMHRHFWSIHARDCTEDHLAHGIWNLMALYHMLLVFPEMNDLTDFVALRGGVRSS